MCDCKRRCAGRGWSCFILPSIDMPTQVDGPRSKSDNRRLSFMQQDLHVQIGTFYLPAIGNRAEINERMAGRRTDLYQKMLRNLAEQARYMDEHGYFGVGFTEHHFHVEGEEVSTNPIMLYGLWHLPCLQF